MNEKRRPHRRRNLSICPITPDPPEILDLVAELKEYLRTIDFYNDSIYEAYFSFEYDGVVYRMDDSVLSTAPSVMVKAEDYVTQRLAQMGADSICLKYRCD